jgi:ribonucleoside-diphosphate reductase alpha chain
LFINNRVKDFSTYHITEFSKKMDQTMFVTKRNGEVQEIAFDKIKERIKKLCTEFNIRDINQTTLCIKVIDQIYNYISTTKLDELTAEQCAYSASNHPDYAILAGAVIVSNHHKNTEASFWNVVQRLNRETDILHPEFFQFVQQHHVDYEAMIDYSRDYLIDYFGFKTLEKSYLLKVNGEAVERVQHMWMRVAIQIHGDNLPLVKETYDLMSTKKMIHATPTNFNSGSKYPQLSSCYLVALEDDSLDGIFNTLKDCASISKWAGGIGLHIHNLRSNGALIHSTGGKTNGIVPMLKVFNDTAKYINQGGKRNGSFAIYLEPWHADVEAFLEMKKTHGDEETKARDLFYALWVPDLFMQRVQSDGMWSLFCPSTAPGLSEVYGAEFVDLYTRYEESGVAKKQIPARSLWLKILTAQMETGTPYLLYKDACNAKSNQKNLGTIKSSNLCTEIIEYSDPTETAVCNLASIVLPSFVKDGVFDHEELHRIAKILTVNLNKIIDLNFYPTEKTRKSNFRHRPIGIGVQGLADAFILMNLPYHSADAAALNRDIFETIYHAAVEQSCELAKEREEWWAVSGGRFESVRTGYTYDETPGLSREQKHKSFLREEIISSKRGAYSTFDGSPASQGILQFDMWGVTPSSRYDWDALKQTVQQYGMRNSLLVAPMPTATTSQILGYNECFEPLTSNIYTRRTLAGEFILANKYLMRELIDLGLWNERMKQNIIANKGSIQHIATIPEHIRNKYKIVWEIPMKHLIDMSADRGAFICQSQSLNLWMEEPTFNKLTSMHMYSFNKGVKTGIYYLRRKAKHQAQQFTVEPPTRPSLASDRLLREATGRPTTPPTPTPTSREEEDEPCESCSA